METIFDRLILTLDDPRHCTVFPSEVAARGWIEHMLDPEMQQRFKAIREDRMISWDHAKALLFPRKDLRVPVNKIHRTIFAQIICAENAGQPFFHYIIPRDYAANSSSFIQTIIGLCPVLEEVFRAAEAQESLYFLAQDLQLLMTRYRQFLDTHELFEPAYESERLDQQELLRSGKTFTLCFPHLLQEYESLKPQLEQVPSITTISPEPLSEIPQLLVYQNSTIEISQACACIEQLLDAGVRAEQVVITLADYTGMYGDLSHQGRLRGLPLRFKSGRPLTDYPVSGLFRDIQGVVSQQFSLSSMKRLLLNRSYPWKDRATAQRLIKAGVAASCLKNYTDARGREVDVWKQRLSRQQDPELYPYYQKLKKSCRALVSAAGAQQLWNSLHIFQHSMLEPYTDGHSNEASAVFSYCIDQLQQFVDVARRVPLPEGFPVYGTYLSLLESVWYVPQQPDSGISVYPYGVSAGIQPAYHLLIGLDQAHTTVIDDPYTMFSEQQRELMEFLPHDMSAHMLSVYLGSGSQVRCSCSRKTRSGQQLPAHLFVEHEQVLEQSDELSGSDPYQLEAQYWSAEVSPAVFPRRLYALQHTGFFHAETSLFQAKRLDLSRSGTLPPDFVSRFARQISSGDGPLIISPTSLDRFLSCPFAWFIRYGLKVEEESYEVEFTDARSEGVMMHRCYERFFSWIIEHAEGKFSSKHLVQYHKELERIMHEELERYSRRFDAPAQVAFHGVEHYVSEHLFDLLVQESLLLDRWKVRSLEQKIVREEPGKPYILEGRIDRVCVQEPGRNVAIIDYKKQNRIKVSSFGPDAEHPDSYQLPLYAYLIEQEDPGAAEVSMALYYDVTKGRYVQMYPYEKGSLVIDRDRFEELIDQMLMAVDSMADDVLHAAVHIPAGAAAGCIRCPFRDICRGRFSIR